MNASRAKDFINFLHKIPIRQKTTKFSLEDKSQFLKPQRLYGQPTYRTHPHLLKAGEIVQGISSDEINYRRIQLMETIKAYSATNYTNIKNHLVVIPSATKKYISASIPYVFRQNSDFVYFSGCLEPDSILALEISEKSMKSIIFLRPKDKNQELWDGVRTGVEGGVELFAVDEANSILNFHAYVERFRTQSNSLIWYDERNSDQKQLNRILRKSENATIENPLKFIHTLRWIKSDAEIDLMRKTCEIGSRAVDMTIKKSYPGISEHQIFAEVDYQTRMNGASMLAYPPVVASGENASTTIHYIANTQLTKDGDMVLLDAGCEYGHYSSDITRTWPLNGEFAEPQRILYEIVLNVQKDLLKALLNPVNTLDDLFDMMCLRLGAYLQEANLIPKDKSGQELARAAYKFCPHHVSHYLGMDVHDTPMVSRSNRLVPGNVFTVEPGIYISPERIDIPQEFRGLGLRIEDDVIVNNQMKIEILTNSVKEPDELLKLIKNKS